MPEDNNNAPARKAAEAAQNAPARKAAEAAQNAPARKAAEAVARLARAYKEADCFLNHDCAWQLMVATILSAQCTDNRVNAVTAGLFREYTSPEALAACGQEELEKAIRPTGFYHVKARNIILSMAKLAGEFAGAMPSDIETLVTFPGVPVDVDMVEVLLTLANSAPPESEP